MLALLLGLAHEASHPAARADDQPPRGRALDLRPTDFLEAHWPGYPEWLAMLGEILAGHPLEPGAGWFRKGIAQTRFDWTNTRSRFDRNRDGTIERREFPGIDADFSRLDRTGDRVLTPADFDFSTRGTDAARRADSDSLEAFTFLDRDGNGRLSPAELNALFHAVSSDPVHRAILAGPIRELERRLGADAAEGHRGLVLSDFQDAFALTSPPEGLAIRLFGRPEARKADAPTLLRGFLRRELGAFGPGPAVNSLAPDFTLRTSDGRTEVRLSERVGARPLVLLFGNLSCGPFRSHAGSLARLVGRYKDRASFLLVYVREAHPRDGWQLESNQRTGVVVAQPRTGTERTRLAQTCRQRLELDMPVLVDTMDDRVGSLYSGPPSRIYLIDREGKIAYKSGRGPFGFKPAELEQSLILLLQSDPPASTRAPGNSGPT